MAKYLIRNVLPFVLCGSFLFTACGKDDDVKKEDEASSENEWIYRVMEENYLWYEEVPDKDKLDFNLPAEDFFNSLLSEKDGKYTNGNHYPFSYIEKKPQAVTKSISETEPSYGFEYLSFRVVDEKNNFLGFYYAEVIYVLPGSPAEEAGLNRGDWIVGAGEEKDNITDIYTLQTGDAVKFQLAQYDDKNTKLVPNGSVDMPAARLLAVTPLLKDTVLLVGGKSIGYLMYNEFVSGPEGYTDEGYNNLLKEIFREFRDAQVTEFVLDLRYNGGGLLSCAQLLASMLAPSQALGKTFAKLAYNDKKQREKNYSLAFLNASSMLSYNLNLQRLYVLTGDRTASASEAVINGLIPYTGRANITLIGEQTVGKTVGSSVFGENEDYDWLLHPIIFRIANANDEADYDEGFPPDIALTELVFGNRLYPFGDTRELLLGQALQEITGQQFRSERQPAPSPSYQPHSLSLERKRTNGLLWTK
jgi:C-terminal processing protease CtpA/Prc